MTSLYIFFVILGLAAQNITRKAYSKKINAPFIFSCISTFCAALFFAASTGNGFIFSWNYIPYALIFGVGYGATMVFNFYAINVGSLALTSLISSFSLLIPTAYGMIFLGEKPGTMLIIGIFLLLVSLILINYEKGEKKITLKWIIYVMLAFVGNGVCMVTQKVQQLNQNGDYKNEFMAVSLFLVTLPCFIFSLILHRDKIKLCLKPISIIPVICGGANALVNYLVMVLAKEDASYVFPLISAGGIVTTGIISLTVYKEHFTKPQFFGMIIGVAAVIFLNM